MVEQSAVNRSVIGSSPIVGAFLFNLIIKHPLEKYPKGVLLIK